MITVEVTRGRKTYKVEFPTDDTDDATVEPPPCKVEDEEYTERWWEIVSDAIDKLAAVVRHDRER